MKKLALVILLGIFLLILPVGAQINILHEFIGGADDGGAPTGSIIISGSTFYGMTLYGGYSNKGTIFKINSLASPHFFIIHTPWHKQVQLG